MICLLIGPPGAGKGTHSDALEQEFSCEKIATGDMLRRHIREKTAIGRQCEAIIASGNLVSDEILWQIIEEELRSRSDKKLILDGYPRNLAQAEQLASLDHLNPVRVVIHLDVDHAQLIDRLSGRRICQKCQRIYHVTANPPHVEGRCDSCGSELAIRPDDQPDRVRRRLAVYADETKPIIDFYAQRGVYARVDGNLGIAAVYEQIKAIFRTKMC